MSDIAIRAEGLSKQYRLGKRERYRTLRDTLTDTLTAPFRRGRSRESSNEDAESFWALKDVSFEVKHGEVIGIIGRNGAGKSTLLKVLSRITEPTEGRAEMHGRVASLLEVGTGFHPELSGRDNIFLNGAILGMKKAEIRRKFDEIVAFAEVDKFIDTPVKHYSSGMYVRLAFAVAAHLEPEILVVDEVLAVGDIEFQNKCLGKMGDVAKQGRTILLVSHNMASIMTLCHSGIVLSGGQIAFAGTAAAAVDRYLSSIETRGSEWNRGDEKTKDNNAAIIVQTVRVTDSEGNPQARFRSGQDIKIRIGCEVRSAIPKLLFVVLIRTSSGIPIFHISQCLEAADLPFDGDLEVTCRLLRCTLYPGKYIVSVWIGRNAYQEIAHITDALTLTMDQGSLPGIDFDLGWHHGVCHCDNEWTVKEVLCAA
jgi:lipopolysaccharide transport system ATP-binding protein